MYRKAGIIAFTVLVCLSLKGRRIKKKGNRKGKVGSEANALRNGGDNVGGPRLGGNSTGSPWPRQSHKPVGSQMLWMLPRVCRSMPGLCRAGRCSGGSAVSTKHCAALQRHLHHSKCAWSLLHGVLGVSQPECHQSLTREGAAWGIRTRSVPWMGNRFLLALECRAGSCHPCSYPQPGLLPLAVYGLSFHVHRNGMICDRQSSSSTVLWRPAVFLSC